MSVDIRNYNALQALSPAALSAYARTSGWEKGERFGDHSDVYFKDDRLEVIIPRTERLGDYARIVAQIIRIFAEASGRDELSLYRALVTSDRDVVQFRGGDGNDGSLPIDDGYKLIDGARNLLLSVACSLQNPQPLYRLGANREATELMKDVCIGQTDQSSFILNILMPKLSPPIPTLFESVEEEFIPIERKFTLRLEEALRATREATEMTISGGKNDLIIAMEKGVSANFCDSLVQLIEPFPKLDVSFLWARTRPYDSNSGETIVRFSKSDTTELREASSVFRKRAPKQDILLHGFVTRLKRTEDDIDGTIYLTTNVDNKQQSVIAVLSRADYEKAVTAHREKALVALKGDLERAGQRWRLLNPEIDGIIQGNSSFINN